MHALSPLQQDALLEIFNIGVGQAAAALSDIVNEKVTMSVPSLSFLERTQAASLVGADAQLRACGISQQFHGAFDTAAVLLFPEHKSLELVQLMLGETMPLAELTTMEQEALSEIGNILLNSCIGVLADMLGADLRGTMPQYHTGSSDEVLGASCGTADGTMLLMLHIEFALEKHQIASFVAFILDLHAIGQLKAHLGSYLHRMGVA